MENRKDKSYGHFESFEQFFEQAEQRPGYWVERVKLEFTEEVLARMAELGCNRSELATRLDAHPGLVTRLLSGRNNFELATMVRIARALDSEFRCHLQPEGTQTCWVDVLRTEPATPTVEWNSDQFKSSRPVTLKVLKDDDFPAAA